MRLLLVEDDPTFRAVLARALQNRGFEVDDAGDIDTARANLAAHAYDVVVADWSLRSGNGADLLSDAEALTRILISGKIPPKSERESSHGFLLKPFDADQLTELIRSLL